MNWGLLRARQEGKNVRLGLHMGNISSVIAEIRNIMDDSLSEI